MASTPQRPNGLDGVFSTLDMLIQTLNNAKDTCGIPPAQIAFLAVSFLLTMIRDTMANDQNYVELGRACAHVCGVLHRNLEGKRPDQLNQSVREAIGDLTATVAGIQMKVIKKGKRNAVSRFIFSKGDKDKITAWNQDLDRVLLVFNTELAMVTNEMVDDTHTMIKDIHQGLLTKPEGTSGKSHSPQTRSAILDTFAFTVLHVYSMPIGELPPPAPRDCFGRDRLIEKIVGLAENLEPVALIGAGGIGKTSIALTVLHHSRIKERFGENRRFIRCDQFPASRAHFLTRLSKVIGARVKHPRDLTSLRPLLSSKKMFIILDNAESILDPKGKGAEEIYSAVEELCQFQTISLLITSRITMVPPCCNRPEIPTLSMEAACDIFYGIYGGGGRSSSISKLLERLGFHALSITLLATTASHNTWDYDRLAKEWGARRAQAVRTDYNKSLAATIELSLASPTFRSLGPNARDLLGVVAFFPQGINEKNLDWLFPKIPKRKNIFDKLCVLSLTYRCNGFITMLAPIRDYLNPKDPRSSSLLCATRDRYFSRLAVDLHPNEPMFEESRWIVAEDVNVEHLLDVFTSIDRNTAPVWVACSNFVGHLCWHKPRQTALASKIEALPDDRRSKPQYLLQLSRLFQRIGNHAERKRILTCALKLARRQGNDLLVAHILRHLSSVNRSLDLFEEGIQQAKEALEVFQRIGGTAEQMSCLGSLARLYMEDKQLDAAEETASRAIDLGTGKGQEYALCKTHQVLGEIHQSKGDKNQAIHHFDTAQGIASPLNWNEDLFWVNYSLAKLFTSEREFDDANAHVERAKSHVLNDARKLGYTMGLQAYVWYLQLRLEEAKLEVLHALEIFEKLGAVEDVGLCRDFLQEVERAMERQSPGLRASASGAPSDSLLANAV